MIHGFDKEKQFVDALDYEDRIRGYLLKIDYGNEQHLVTWAWGKHFDIVIDDGSHEYLDIIVAFKHLWPCAGRYYIIEDIQATVGRDRFLDLYNHFYYTLRNDPTIASIVWRPTIVIFEKK
jgi:hypothetical protein